MKKTTARERPPATHLTRRNWAMLLAAAPGLAAQVATTPQTPPPVSAPPPSTPAQGFAKAVSDVKQVSDRLTQIEVPMAVEPAFSFHV